MNIQGFVINKAEEGLGANYSVQGGALSIVVDIKLQETVSSYSLFLSTSNKHIGHIANLTFDDYEQIKDWLPHLLEGKRIDVKKLKN